MAKLENYNGSIKIIDGLSPFGEDYPLMDAHHVQTGEDGTRLDDALENKVEKINNNTSDRYVYMADKKGESGDRIVLGMGSGASGVNMPKNGLMLPLYNGGTLCVNDPKLDYQVVNLRTLNAKLSENSGGNKSEWDFVIDSFDNIGEISNMYGNVLIQCEIPADSYPDITVPKAVKYLKIDIPFTSDYMLSSVSGHLKCTLEGCQFGRSGDVYGFREVRNVIASDATISECMFVYNCEALHFSNCNYIELSSFGDTGGNDGQSASISRCNHICHIDYNRTSAPLEIINCGVVENISGEYGAGNLTITNAKTVENVSNFESVTYKNCKYVNPHTCQGYVTQMGANGKVQILTQNGSFKAVDLSAQIAALTARLDANAPLDPEVPTEFAWMDLVSALQTVNGEEQAQHLFTYTHSYDFEGHIRSEYEFEGDGFDSWVVPNGIRFKFEFVPDSVPVFYENGIVSGKISNFEVFPVCFAENPYNPGVEFGMEIYSHSLNNDYAEMSITSYFDEYGGPAIEVGIAFDAAISYFYEDYGEERAVSGKFYLFKRIYYESGNAPDGFLDITAYLGKTSQTEQFFPQTMSLRQQSLNRQLIAFLEDRIRSREQTEQTE